MKIRVSPETYKTLQEAKRVWNAAAWRPNSVAQALAITSTVPETLLEGNRGGGKGLPHDQKILTDTGWKRVGEVTFADRLLAPDGTYTSIEGIYPQGLKPVYRFTFDDGASVEADNTHLWDARSGTNGYRDGWRTKSTEELIALIQKDDWYIPTMSSPAPGEAWFGPDPYVIGQLLGEGTMTGSRPTLYTADDWTRDYMVNTHGWRAYNYGRSVWMVQSPYAQKEDWTFWVSRKIGAYKAVSKALLEADPESRLSVLQGLMDSDGSIDLEGRCTFFSISKQLAEDVQYLVRSLGGKATVNWCNKVSGKITEYKRLTAEHNPDGYYKVQIMHCNKFNPFRLPRKAERVKKMKGVHRKIVSIERIEDKETTCFKVDHPSHLFVCQDFIVTHNTITLLMTYAVHVDRGYGAAWRGIIFRNTYKALEDIINQSKKVFWRIWPTATFNETERLWKFPNGESLKFSQFATPDDYYTWHGQEFPFIGWEELTNYPTPACYKSMMSCNRSSVIGIPKLIRATTNPSGPGKRWVKTYFDLPDSRNKIRSGLKDEDGYDMQDRLAIHFKYEDNIDLVKADPAYMTRVRQSAANAEIKKAWVDGDWNAQSGGYFDDVFEPSVHMIPKFMIPSGWPIYRAFDWGSAHPYSYGIYTVCPEACEVEIRTKAPKLTVNGWVEPEVVKMRFIRGDVIRIFEDYGWNGSPNQGLRLMPSAMAARFKRLETMWGIHKIVKDGPAGIDLWDSSKGKSPVEEYEKHGIGFYKAYVASGSRVAGLQLIRSMLFNANPKDEDGNPIMRENPGLFFIEANNSQALRLFLEIMPDPDNPDDFLESAEDHIFDEIRYFLTRRDMTTKQHHA